MEIGEHDFVVLVCPSFLRVAIQCLMDVLFTKIISPSWKNSDAVFKETAWLFLRLNFICINSGIKEMKVCVFRKSECQLPFFLQQKGYTRAVFLMHKQNRQSFQYFQVQAQVKKTKARFDKLKLDVMQKVDLLAASRCNMFSHVLANYQSSLLHFWEKTSRTMTAVAESFKGYQYYEFSIIKVSLRQVS